LGSSPASPSCGLGSRVATSAGARAGHGVSCSHSGDRRGRAGRGAQFARGTARSAFNRDINIRADFDHDNAIARHDTVAARAVTAVAAAARSPLACRPGRGGGTLAPGRWRHCRLAFATAGTAGTPLPLAGLAQLLACGSAWRFLYAAVRRVPQMLSPPQHRHSRGPLPPCGGRGREAPNQRGVAQDPIVDWSTCRGPLEVLRSRWRS
jgi:hypothetical protein